MPRDPGWPAPASCPVVITGSRLPQDAQPPGGSSSTGPRASSRGGVPCAGTASVRWLADRALGVPETASRPAQARQSGPRLPRPAAGDHVPVSSSGGGTSPVRPKRWRVSAARRACVARRRASPRPPRTDSLQRAVRPWTAHRRPQWPVLSRRDARIAERRRRIAAEVACRGLTRAEVRTAACALAT